MDEPQVNSPVKRASPPTIPEVSQRRVLTTDSPADNGVFSTIDTILPSLEFRFAPNVQDDEAFTETNKSSFFNN